MSRNGSGTYSLPAGNPVVTGTTVSSTWANNTLSDIATALTGSIAADGQTPVTANIPMNGKKLTGLAAGTTSGDALSYGQAAMGPISGTTGAFSGAVSGTTGAFTGLVTGSVGMNVGNVASATATTLDWYEEGTATPTIAGSTTSGTATYTTQNCFWRRVGNVVDFYIDIAWSGHTGTGNTRLVHGIPYLPTTSQTLVGQFEFTSGVGSVREVLASNGANWTILTLNGAQSSINAASNITVNGRFFML
jgi:hypothetical protein